jgi:hypothetical protein
MIYFSLPYSIETLFERMVTKDESLLMAKVSVWVAMYFQVKNIGIKRHG